MRETSIALALSGLSFIMSVIWGGPLLRVLHHFKIGKIIRVVEPTRHLVKMGTPTMGGVMVIFPAVMLTGLLNAAALLGLNQVDRFILLPMVVMVAYGILGAIDDWEGIRGPRRGLGMRARTKFIFQMILALATAVVLYQMEIPHLYWPHLNVEIDLGLWYIPLATFVIVSMTNAVNFTDGMDGLAGLTTATAFIFYGAIALAQDQVFLGQLCFILVGAMFGFLWFNVHPAKMIMGDCGALSLGAMLGLVALMTGQWLLLPLIAVIPFCEALSDVIQIVYFRLTKGKRIFRMAPIHYHFELMGWSETQVVQRFWLISLLFGMLGFGLAVW
ncbi:MAG: phospho-N-acetylmuramoyl-pentapeptide-transferase [Chloroflexi bacterium]|nr:phospho-N-acetylmuramoyl-pentapeptide-transferase [Chloroflexota bacterium]